MNDSKYRYILYIIIIVIISTIGIQAYWNYKNYLSSKQQLINDVQVSLDKAVDDYYTALAQKTTLALKLEGSAQKDVFKDGGVLDRISKSIDESKGEFIEIDSDGIENLEGITVLRGFEVDSMIEQDEKSEKKSLSPEEFKDLIKDIKAKDSVQIDISNFEMLTSKVVMTISNDTLNIPQIDSLFKLDLNRKNIDLDYRLDYKAPDTDSLMVNMIEHTKTHKSLSKDKLFLSATSKSTLLPMGSSLSVEYKNETWVVLQRIIWGILISTLLVLAVISCLFYLLKIIKHQKQLAEVKNDLISNITHEFKTPIATIGVALESIQNFNAIDDKEKAKTYLDMSRTQLSKLNTMVEKLLETASLDSENLELNTDSYNISEVITTIAEKHKLHNTEKTITYTVEDDIYANVDIFHFENAINNIVDNAFKYGGNDIFIDLKRQTSQIDISIADNGNFLSKTNKDKVFEKFYRVPQGNTHDVKGFGIGLYYTKKIIEKHQGTITLDLKNGLTTFKISLPNV
jgi:signal transduction histidine kinase